jgi:hypothetical protein
MPRLLYHSRPHGTSRKPRISARASSQPRDMRYRRACFEQLEDRRALATVPLDGGSTAQAADSSPLAQFEAAAFPRMIQLNTALGLTPVGARADATASAAALQLTRQQQPLLVVPSADGRPVAASIDRSQATTAIETNVRLRQESPVVPGNRTALDTPNVVRETGPTRWPPAAVKPIGRYLPPTPSATRSEVTLRPLPGNGDAKHLVPQDARTAVAEAQSATSGKQAELAPPQRKFTPPAKTTSTNYSAVDSSPSSLKSDDLSATDLLYGSPRRSTAPARTAASEPATPAEGREYLSNVQTVIFAAAAVATALVLPGIVSEIRRRKKRVLPLIARAQRSTQMADEQIDQDAATLPIREKAG